MSTEIERPDGIPEGYIHQSTLRERGWAPDIIRKLLKEHGLSDGEVNPSRSPYWYPESAVTEQEPERQRLAAEADAAAAVAAEKAAAEKAAADALLIPRDDSFTNEGAWSRIMLKQSGWTDTLIKRHLGEPDFIRTTSNDRHMYLWARDRVIHGPDLIPELHKSLVAEGKRRRRKAERERAKQEADTLTNTHRTLIGEPFTLHRIAGRHEKLVYHAGEILHITRKTRTPGNPDLNGKALLGKRFLCLLNSGVRPELDLDFDHAFDRLVEVEPTAEELAADAAEEAAARDQIVRW